MRPGPALYPRQTVNPEFRAAVRRAMLRDWPAWKLADVAGYPCVASFSRDLHRDAVMLTPLVIRRFEAIAAAVGFRQAAFLEVADETMVAQ